MLIMIGSIFCYGLSYLKIRDANCMKMSKQTNLFKYLRAKQIRFSDFSKFQSVVKISCSEIVINPEQNKCLRYVFNQLQSKWARYARKLDSFLNAEKAWLNKDISVPGLSVVFSDTHTKISVREKTPQRSRMTSSSSTPSQRKNWSKNWF